MALLLTGCGVQAIDLPLPGTAMSGDGYRISIAFASALNLPAKAKVYLDGVEVGIVDTISLRDRDAVVDAHIRKGVVLSAQTTARIKQSSLLGDLYVNLSQPTSGSKGTLSDGGHLPRSQTSPADNVEDMLRSISTFVVGAPFADIASVVNEVNSAMPSPAELISLRRAGLQALHDVATSEPELNTILDSAASISATLGRNSNRVDYLLTQGPPRVAGLADVLFGTVDLMFGVAHLTRNITPLLKPLTPDLSRILGVLRPTGLALAKSDQTLAMDMTTFNALLKEKLIPYFNSPLNLRVHTDATAPQQADQLIAVLRGLGMVR
ncbi:MlaD family protein [Gordonia sp. CPCC 205333]|uniref:MlaD family protein n=1 Tax=Gordonia sp. CPCC 205333 TaxID=3140790 RepID=UPI003AF35618